VFSGGYTADGAYWIDQTSGTWITSTFYASKLPEWVERFNSQRRADKYWDLDWKDASGKVLRQTGRTPQSKFYEVVGETPFATEYQLEFARELITQEKLGSGTATDLLVVSLSSMDILGHKVGPDGPELQEFIVDLDRRLAEFFAFLGRQIGLANIWIALSSDHGTSAIPAEARKLRIPAASMSNPQMRKQLNAELSAQLGAGEYVAEVRGAQVYLSSEAFTRLKMDQTQAEGTVGEALLRAGMRASFTKSQLARGEVPPGEIGQRYLNSYSPHSGWYVLALPPPFQIAVTQSTHGSAYTYDRRVPLALFGLPFQPGQYRNEVEPVDLAVTLASLLGINAPAAAQGRVLTEALAQRATPSAQVSGAGR
ncbi:MAG: alkaline phosphatase family protein, partial [Candidatus Korobacteraceae bacterium]